MVKNRRRCATLNSDSNRKSTPPHGGSKGNNIRRRRKWRPYDGRDEPLINEIFNQLVSKQIRVETGDGEPETLLKYHHHAKDIIYSVSCYGEENPFVISVSDLSPDLIIRLLDSRRKDYILYRVVERFIEIHNRRFIAPHMELSFLAPHKERRYPWHFHP
jgi:hypothetical protein